MPNPTPFTCPYPIPGPLPMTTDQYYLHPCPSLVILPTIKHFILQLPIGSIVLYFQSDGKCYMLVPHANNPLNRMIESRISLTKSIPFINKLETLQHCFWPLRTTKTHTTVSGGSFELDFYC